MGRQLSYAHCAAGATRLPRRPCATNTLPTGRIFREPRSINCPLLSKPPAMLILQIFLLFLLIAASPYPRASPRPRRRKHSPADDVDAKAYASVMALLPAALTLDACAKTHGWRKCINAGAFPLSSLRALCIACVWLLPLTHAVLSSTFCFFVCADALWRQKRCSFCSWNIGKAQTPP